MTRRVPIGSVLDMPLPLRWVEKAEACHYCREPTHWRTETNRRTHPTCADGWCYGLADEGYLAAYRLLVTTFDRSTVIPMPLHVEPPRGRTGPCSWCGQLGIAQVGSPYLHCRHHLLWISAVNAQERTAS